MELRASIKSAVANFNDSRACLTIAVIGIVLTLPLMCWGLPFISDDGVWHFLYLEGFSEQLFAGDLYPRWIARLNAGLGSPTFYFYPPVSYYLSSVFKILPISTWHQLGWTTALSLPASGLATYFWLKNIVDDRSAFFASVVYLILPYRIFDIYARGAVAESLTFVWMPLILMCIYRTKRGSYFAFLGLCVGFALMLGTHLPTTMIFAPVALGYALVDRGPMSKSRVLFMVLAAFVIATAMAAAYVIPAMTLQGLVNFGEMREGIFSYQEWFIGSNLRAQGSPRYFWMIFQPGLLILLGYFASRKQINRDDHSNYIFWGAVFFASAFMTLGISRPVWALFTPLQVLQFPWRFNSILSVSALPLFAIAWSKMIRPFSGATRLYFGYLCLIGTVWVMDVPIKTYKYFFTEPEASRRLEERTRALTLKADWHSFWPRTVPKEAGSSVEEILGKLREPDGEIPFVKFVNGGGDAVVSRRNGDEIALEINTAVPSTLSVSQFYFENRTAKFSGSDQELALRPSNLGLISFDVPAGEHRVEIITKKLDAEMFGERISAVSIFAMFIALAAIFLRRLRKTETTKKLTA
ncbi:MAG: 6-pyruvoyl-tetrahydropterin synthase-related protein [Pyrinomonadaceae bacterium]